MGKNNDLNKARAAEAKSAAERAKKEAVIKAKIEYSNSMTRHNIKDGGRTRTHGR